MAMTIKTQLGHPAPQHRHLLPQLYKNSQHSAQHLLQQHHQQHLSQQSITIYQQHNENKQLKQRRQWHLFNSLFKVGKVKISMCQQYKENKQLKQLKQQAPPPRQLSQRQQHLLLQHPHQQQHLLLQQE
jgi:hypothetical protein